MSIPAIGPIAAASYWGAKHGPGILRRVHDGGRTWKAGAVIAGYAVFTAVLTAAWVAIIVYGVPLFSLVFGIAAMSGWAFVAEGLARWWWHPRALSGPVLTTAPSGLPATSWPRSRASMVRVVGLLSMLLLSAVGEVLAASVGDHAWGYAAPVLLVLVALWLALPVLRGRVEAGALHLTTRGIEHRWGAATVEVGWDDVELLAPSGPFGLRNTPGLTFRRGGWFIDDPVDHVEKPNVAIPLAYLPSRPGRVIQQVEEYLGVPERRAALGTTRSLDWYAARAAGDR